MTANLPSEHVPYTGGLSMQGQESDRSLAFLDAAVSAGSSSREVAESVATAFRSIDEALMPVIGQRGVAALYKRAVHLATPAHPLLPNPGDGVPVAIDVGALTTALAQQTPPAAAAAGAHLLNTFYGLLTGLIGPSLAERLLRSFWATLLSGPSARDTQS